MRNLLIVLILLSCNSSEQEATQTTPEKEVTMVLEQQVKAWNNGDIDGFMKGYWTSDSLKFITKRGVRYGYDSVALNYKRSYADKQKMGHLEFSNLTTESLSIDHSIMNVCGNWEISGSYHANGYFSLIMKRINGQYKIVIDHTW